MTAPSAIAARSGLDFIRGFISGEVPPPPAATLLGITVEAAEHGLTVMSIVPGRQHSNPMGTMHGGIIATLLDSVMGCAVQTTLPARRGYTTLEIKVNYLRAVTEASGRLTAEGRVVHSGRRAAVAEARVTDAAGKLCATASTTCLVFDLEEQVP